MSPPNESQKRRESTIESQSTNKKHRGRNDDKEVVNDYSIYELLGHGGGNGKPDDTDEEDGISETGSAAKLDTTIADTIFPRREIDWTEDMWWTVEESPSVTAGTALAPGAVGALPLRERCEALYGWSQRTGQKVLKAYRQFLTLKKVFKDWDAKILDPSPMVDRIWKAHVLDTKNYVHDMLLLCGHIVHYNPTAEIDQGTSDGRRRRKATYDGLVGYFGRDEIDIHIWAVNFDPDPKEPIFVNITDSTNDPPIVNRFVIRVSTKLGIIFSNYAQHRQVDVDHVHLYYRGRYLTKTDTPNSLGLRNNTGDVEFTAIISPAQPIPTMMDCNPNEGFDICVRETSGADLVFRIKAHTHMSKVFNSYANIKGVCPTGFLFKFNGVEMKPTDTAETHSLAHHDRIDVCRRPINDGTLTIRVLSTFADELHFKMKKETPMSKLFGMFKALCMGDENHAKVRFVFNGNDIRKEDTPESIELVDNDTIYCLTSTTPGGVLSSSAGKKPVKKKSKRPS